MVWLKHTVHHNFIQMNWVAFALCRFLRHNRWTKSTLAKFHTFLCDINPVPDNYWMEQSTLGFVCPVCFEPPKPNGENQRSVPVGMCLVWNAWIWTKLVREQCFVFLFFSHDSRAPKPFNCTPVHCQEHFRLFCVSNQTGKEKCRVGWAACPNFDTPPNQTWRRKWSGDDDANRRLTLGGLNLFVVSNVNSPCNSEIPLTKLAHQNVPTSPRNNFGEQWHKNKSGKTQCVRQTHQNQSNKPNRAERNPAKTVNSAKNCFTFCLLSVYSLWIFLTSSRIVLARLFFVERCQMIWKTTNA